MADDIQKNNPVTIPVVSAGDQQPVPNNLLVDDPNDPFNETKKELRTRFELLPEEIQKVIVDESYQLKLFEIAKTQKLTYEELSILEVETTMVLLGMTKPEDYRDTLQMELKRNDPEVDALVAGVNEKVFGPIRSLIQKLYEVKTEPIDFLKPKEQTTGSLEQKTNEQTVTKTPEQNVVVPTPTLSSADHAILAKTGVVISETPKPVSPIQTAQMPSRNDVLKGIENPQRTPSLGIVADKLNNSGSVMPTKTTDYSVLKTPTTAPATPSVNPTPTKTDPYRETIG